jgi:glycosyltransferase involved in cell wall biosynthesis
MGRVLVASAGDRDWLVAHDISPDRIRVLPTPLSEEAFLPGDPAWALGQIGGFSFVLYLGRLHEEKGVDDLLETVPRLPNGLRLVYAGPDAGRLGALRQRARGLGVSDRVSFLGVVTEEEKRSLLAACTALALPSLFEAQGLAVLEAWAQSRPVVATRVGALPEMISDGENGLLVPYHDVPALAAALTRTSTEREAAEAMGARGRTVAEAFRLEKLGPQLETIYRDLLASESLP